MEISKELKELLDGFKEQFGYELKTINVENDEILEKTFIEYLVFERTTVENNHQELTLEDHRWEKSCEDFDPKKHPADIGDWLIFSYITDEDRDWFGNFVNTQYPLTYSEYKIIEKIIQQCEKESAKKGE